MTKAPPPENFEAMRADLRACTSIAEVEAVADKWRPELKAMGANRETKAYALIVANLKWYMINHGVPDAKRIHE